MISAIVNSLVDHVYRLLNALLSGATTAPTPLVDGIAGMLALVLLCAALVYATNDNGSHRKRFGVPAVVVLPRERSWSHVFTSPNARALGRAVDRLEGPTQAIVIDAIPLEAEQGGVHVGAHALWHPADDIAAVDNADAEWETYLASARRERAELRDDLKWSTDWDDALARYNDAMSTAMSTADAWHVAHGRHCECCHVEVEAGRRVLVDRGWRIGSDTIEIRTETLVAAGVR